MRCPQCTERNSVASRKCEYCGEKFKSKPVPLGLKLAIGGIAVAVTASIAASYVVPHLADPEQSLSRVAKHMGAGPSSPEDAQRIKKDFNEAMKAYLKSAGGSKSSDLTQALQKILPSTAYEVHVVDLPRGLKVVEVDAILQACDFLVMKTSAGVKVFDLPGFEVFDDARILTDSAGPVLALVGHTGGQPPHRPQVRTYALLPDFISDETEKLVPPLIGDGTARFDRNDHDIKLELSKPSVTRSERKSRTGREEIVHGMLRWKEARYVADYGRAAAALAQRPDLVPAQPQPAQPVAVAPVVNKPKIIVRDTTTPTNVDPMRDASTRRHQVPESGAALAAIPVLPPVAPVAVQSNRHERRHRNSQPTSETSTRSSQRTGYIAGSGVTVRSDARRGSDSLGSLGHGESVTIVGEHEGWYRIRYQGQNAWVFSDLVQTSSHKSNPEPVVASTSSARSSRRHRNSTPVAVATPEPTRTSSSRSSNNSSTRSRKTNVRLASTAEAPPPATAGGGHRRRQPIIEQPNLVP